MHATKTLLLLTSCALCIAFAQAARADYFGLEVIDRSSSYPICQDPSNAEIPFKLSLCEVHAIYDNPTDRLISVAFTNVSTTDPAGFFQHPLGGNTAPPCAFISLYPTLVCDSFVSLGVDCFDLIDRTTTDPDFDFTAFNTSGEVSGGWFNSAPSSGQGDPDANGRVMIARFSYKQNKNTSGDVCIFTQLDGSKDIVAFLLEPFDCSVPGGGLPGSGQSDPGCVDATGNCFEANATIGCDCTPCCNLICSLSPFCCDETWDGLCALLACDPDQGCDVLACQDCNNNGRKDGEDIACGGGETCGTIPGSYDCNNNGTPDECEIDMNSPAPGTYYCPGQCNPVCGTCTGLCDPDCNFNGIPDECDIASGSSPDSDGNGIPDECQDCNGNGIIDMCETDCGAPGGPCDGVPGCGTSPDDCDGNGIPDECDVAVRGPIFVSGANADELAHCETALACGRLYPAVIEWALDKSRITPADETKPILAIGLNGVDTQAVQALGNWLDGIEPTPGLDIVTEIDPNEPFSIPNVNFADYAVIYVPSVAFWTDGGITNAQLAALNTRTADIEVFLDFLGGGVVALTEGHPPEGGASHRPYDWLHFPIGFFDIFESDACPTPALAQIPGHTADCNNQSGFHYHNQFGDQLPSTGVVVLATSPSPESDALLVGRVDLAAELDCNANGTPDGCDIDACFPGSPEFPGCADCNQNGIPDECDIADGTSPDSNADGVPDECDCGTCPWDSPVGGPNGVVGPEDLAYILGNWGPIPPDADIALVCIDNLDPNPGNGNIGPEDLAKILGHWGPCPP
ncbi:MAG: hypothetical protein O7D91_04575 [Planctomycetota bacterium]|nr:hypothetical protein [Planctomycetota bacterium]